MLSFSMDIARHEANPAARRLPNLECFCSVPTDSPAPQTAYIPHTLPESFIASRARLVSSRIWLRPIKTQNTTSFAFDLGFAEYGRASQPPDLAIKLSRRVAQLAYITTIALVFPNLQPWMCILVVICRHSRNAIFLPPPTSSLHAACFEYLNETASLHSEEFCILSEPSVESN